MPKFSPPPGTADIFPQEAQRWRWLENAALQVFPLYGYGELRTPIFEYTEVFTKGIGNETEVVQKEMYTFHDRGGRSLTLRPEGTAGVMRALLNTDVANGNEKRVFYLGPMFRGERPAAGRRRQFHQVGVENVGKISPELDAENMVMLKHYLETLQITGAKLLVNSRGNAQDRQPAEEVLRKYFSNHLDSMCNDCKERINRNLWRILDCKQSSCREIVDGAPNYTAYYSTESQKYFDKVCSILSTLNVDFEIDKKLVRGLDYYAHTVYEVVHPELGAQSAIAGGGRYELLLPQTKKAIQGVGFAAGMERLLLVQDALKIISEARKLSSVFLISLGEAALTYNINLAHRLRNCGIPVQLEFENKSMKAQMRSANRVNATFAVICGDNELEKGVVIGREMATGEQKEYTIDELINFVQNT